MTKSIICECPYAKYCHNPRQKLQTKYRNEVPEYGLKDCPAFQIFKENKLK